MIPQTRIDLEMDANAVLATLLRFNIGSRAAQLLHLGPERVEAAIQWLRVRDYLTPLLGVTQEGREYHEGARRRPMVGSPQDAHAFRVEALTGIVERSGRHGTITERSEIDRAVLPRTAPARGWGENPEEMAALREGITRQRRRVANELGITVEELDAYVEQGRVRLCRGGDSAHMGIFDRHDGQRLQHQCRRCRKARR